MRLKKTPEETQETETSETPCENPRETPETETQETQEELTQKTQELILDNDPSIREAHAYQSWLGVRETFERVMHWRALLSHGYSQSMIAVEEGLTRARVCQLMKLLQLGEEVWSGVMEGDESYMGVSLRSLTRGL